jgi:NADPH-dependent glutamate synthase beta subunit-like oxidoreductase
MPRLVIDGREVEVPEGATVLVAARRLGIDIPTLCYLEGLPAGTSCMACVVKVNGREALVPSCATRAEDGMRVESETDEVREARRAALELLLGDHVGDCLGPCHGACPAHMDIPRMIREIARGDLRGAIETVKARIALPAVLGRICPAPCERACRRGAHDAPLAIMHLKRRAADADLAGGEPYLPPRQAPSGRRVAVAGAGPTGLAAAYYLLQDGHACTLLDDHERAGGALRYAVDEDRLPRAVLEAEIGVLSRLGAEFRAGVRVGRNVALADLSREFDAVVLAIGEPAAGEAERLDLKAEGGRIAIAKETFETSLPGVFAAGDAVRKGNRMAVRAVADGRAVAGCVADRLAGRPIGGPHREFTVHIGQVTEAEMAAFLAGASDVPRVEPAGGPGAGLAPEEARREAARCLRCDCRKPVACKLRRYADLYGARPARYKGERRPFTQYADHPDLVYEPGKCIACGICIRIAEAARERLGLAFIGRGFRVRVGVPFGETVAEGLRETGLACAEACPTGALARKRDA